MSRRSSRRALSPLSSLARPLRRPAYAALAAGLAVSLAATTVPASAAAAAAAASADPGRTAAALPTRADDVPLTVTGLQTNARVDPLGIPGAAPTLSWHSTSPARDVVQSAYQVRVASSEDALASPDVWDTGKVVSEQQVDLRYGGPALTSATRYVWQVRVWDGDDAASAWSEPASFETGLLDAGDWGGADWIGAPAGSELARWTDYTATFDFTIDNLVFGTYLRAADLGNGYMWQLSVADGTPRFRPHRKVDGSFSLVDNVDISRFVTAQELRTGRHTMSVAFAGSTITTSLDGEVIDTRTDTTFGRGFVGFRTDQANEGAEAQTVHDVRVTTPDDETLLDTDFATAGNPFTGGTQVDGGLRFSGRVDALWRSPDGRMPQLRTEFATPAGKTVTRARVYATARGVYELDLNGHEVGDQHLAPGWTDYRTRFQHQTYDVTDLVTAGGTNALTADLASGWWAGKVGMWGPGVYGTDLSLLARLRVDYSDGTSQWVDTDDAWTTRRGPYTFTDNIDGETYDARLATPGWQEPGYDDSGWPTAAVTAAPEAPVVPQPDEPVRTTQELATVARTEPTPGAHVYDLGQNMVGVARMRLTGRAGDTVTVRYGEVLNPDGTLYTANLRAAKVTDRYTFATDGTVTYEPTFTQHGFRYVEITGTTSAPATDDVTGVVWGSDLAATGTLDTSDPMLDQLASNISWGQRGNFLSIPTDTPARDERLGWTGDINVFAPTASYLRDTRAFLSKWMVDLTDATLGNGNLPGIAPVPPGVDLGSGLGWSDAVVTVPYAVWRAQGDTAIVRDNYAAMARFMDFVRTGAGDDLIDTARGNWDDWLNLDDPTPTSVLGTAYLAENARMMAEMAKALGKDADAADYAALSRDVRTAFTDTLVQPDGTVDGGSQTAYAMALGMDLVDDAALRDEVAARFVAKLASRDNHLSTGFLGTPWLLPALSAIDRDDLAYTLLTHKDYPSWGYEVENGATTMWERWDSIKPDGSFGDVGMNSFNHYAYGAVGDWMYQNIGAIKAVEAGYKVSRIEPNVGGGLTHGEASFASPYGPIATDWDAGDDGALSLAVTVPVGTTAQVVLPAENAYTVLESGALVDGVDGVHSVVDDGDTVTVTVGSGDYDFDVAPAQALLGTVIEDLAALGDRVEVLVADGDLAAADGERVGTDLDATEDAVRTALLAAVGDDAAGRRAGLESALDRLRALRAWLSGDETGVDEPVRDELDSALAAIEVRLERGLSSALGVTVAVPPVATAALPGSAVTGTVELANDSAEALTGLRGTLTVDGLGEAELSSADLAPGETRQVPVVLDVPTTATPGRYDASWSWTYATQGETHTVRDATPGWATVSSGLELGEVALADAAATGTPGAERRLVVTVPVTNTGTAAVRAHAALALPAGWRTVPSPDTLLAAGETTTLRVPVVVPVDLVAGDVPAEVSVVRGADVLLTGDATLPVTRTVPPAGALDHVDLGDQASESAHAVQAGPHSGTNVEAGLTRRYANSAFPGSWYSVEVDVPRGEPFVLRAIETFDGARTKKYHVEVDGVRVRTQLVPRTQGGSGTKVYDALVDDPSLTGNDGRVRVRFEYPADASGFFDPSIADLWVLPAPGDEAAPDVTAVVATGTPGDQGWYRSDVTVRAAAADDADATPVVETGLSGSGTGWQSYVGPVAVTGEGRHVVSFRATDAAGHRSAVGRLDVGIDATAPATRLTVTRGAQPERATFSLTASDALSGVGVTRYRLDGGAWTSYDGGPVEVRGFGEHVVEYASTDVAGNPEVVRQADVVLKDVEQLAPVLAPQVAGTPKVGATLRGTAGTWNTSGVTVTRQWLRDGRPIARATASTYRVTTNDVGHRLALRVTARKTGLAPATATSAATAPVARAAARVGTTLDRTLVPAGRSVRVKAVVRSTSTPGGRVSVLRDGRVVRTLWLRHGAAATTVPVPRGTHRISVRYLGSAGVAPATSAARTVRGY